MSKLVFFVFIIVLLGCSKDDDFDDDLLFQITDSNYPTFYQKLSENEMEEYQNRFAEGSITFSLIDSFGFVGWSYEDDFEIRKSLHEKQFSDVSALLKMIKLFLVEKSEFTGVTDTSLISDSDVNILFQDYGGIYIRSDSTKYNSISVNFGSQAVDGLEIYNSLLTVSATANGVHRIFGHWYPDVYIPETDKVSVDLAKSVLVGHELTSHDGWGNKLSHIIVAEDFEDYQKIIYPYINKNCLELRVCWKFAPSHWQLFMDTTTGEILMETDIAFYPL